MSFDVIVQLGQKVSSSSRIIHLHKWIYRGLGPRNILILFLVVKYGQNTKKNERAMCEKHIQIQRKINGAFG